jgi:hypothetical protein
MSAFRTFEITGGKDRESPRADINRCTNRHRTAETFWSVFVVAT